LLMNEPIGRAKSLAPDAPDARKGKAVAGSELSSGVVHPAMDEPKQALSRR